MTKRKAYAPILQTLPTGGSGTGLSYWQQWVDCAKQAAFDEEYRDITAPHPLTTRNPKPFTEKSSGDNFYTQAGNILHKFQELYHNGMSFDTTKIRFTNTVDPKAAGVGEAMFRAYRAKYTKNHWGRVLGVEKKFKGKKATQRAWGHIQPPEDFNFTMAADLLTKVTDKRAKELRKIHNFDRRMKAGTWLLDWKSGGWLSSGKLNMFMERPQFTIYMHVVRLWYPDLRGLICVFITRAAKPEITPILVPFPNRVQLARAQALLKLGWFRRQEALMSKLDKPHGNPNHCHRYEMPCLWFREGICQGY